MRKVSIPEIRRRLENAEQQQAIYDRLVAQREHPAELIGAEQRALGARLGMVSSAELRALLNELEAYRKSNVDYYSKLRAYLSRRRYQIAGGPGIVWSANPTWNYLGDILDWLKEKGQDPERREELRDKQELLGWLNGYKTSEEIRGDDPELLAILKEVYERVKGWD